LPVAEEKEEEEEEEERSGSRFSTSLTRRMLDGIFLKEALCVYVWMREICSCSWCSEN
jgi:hypothetical protein